MQQGKPPFYIKSRSGKLVWMTFNCPANGRHSPNNSYNRYLIPMFVWLAKVLTSKQSSSGRWSSLFGISEGKIRYVRYGDTVKRNSFSADRLQITKIRMASSSWLTPSIANVSLKLGMSFLFSLDPTNSAMQCYWCMPINRICQIRWVLQNSLKNLDYMMFDIKNGMSKGHVRRQEKDWILVSV